MNIEQMAREAGFGVCTPGTSTHANLASFAALVRAQALEEAAVVCEHEASMWRGEQDITDFKLCASRIRALKASPDAGEG